LTILCEFEDLAREELLAIAKGAWLRYRGVLAALKGNGAVLPREVDDLFPPEWM
jgi:hypothetical protein